MKTAAVQADLPGETGLLTVEGEVFEVLDGYGLAHVRTSDSSIYALNRQTPGVLFENLQAGQRVRMNVTLKFRRVLHALLLS
jgi:hypothetical protein